MKDSFTAIDFETAQGKHWSICQVGLVRYEAGIITNELSILVQPPGNIYWDMMIDVHGITPADTKNERSFDKIWSQLKPFIDGQAVVAHNGFSFDFQCLSQVLDHYQLPQAAYEKHCTYKIYRKKLSTLCEQHCIPLNHHDALSDARACGELFLKQLKQK